MPDYSRARQLVADSLAETLRLGQEVPVLSQERAGLQQVGEWLQEAGAWLDRLSHGVLPVSDEDATPPPWKKQSSNG